MSIKTALVVLNYNDYLNTINYVKIMKNYSIISKIIVVDNNSTDDSVEKLLFLKSDKIDIVLSDKNGGYAYGNNVGLKNLDEKYGENHFTYIIISNPDISVEESTISNCFKEFELNKNAAIVAPRMHFVNGPSRRSSWENRTFAIDIASSTRLTEFFLYPLFKKGEYSKKEFLQKKLKVQAIAGSFFVARYSMFKEIGYFDENTFLFFEEDILGKKMEEKGYDIISLNNFNFIHYDSQTIGKVINAFKKIDILFDSKKYYHKKYNNISITGLVILAILKNIRKIELLFEIPIIKVFIKIKKYIISKENI